MTATVDHRGVRIDPDALARLHRQVMERGPPASVLHLREQYAREVARADALAVAFGGHIDMSAVHDCVRLRMEIDRAYAEELTRS